jgi:hypothetical protein
MFQVYKLSASVGHVNRLRVVTFHRLRSITLRHFEFQGFSNLFIFYPHTTLFVQILPAHNSFCSNSTRTQLLLFKFYPHTTLFVQILPAHNSFVQILPAHNSFCSNSTRAQLFLFKFYPRTTLFVQILPAHNSFCSNSTRTQLFIKRTD